MKEETKAKLRQWKNHILDLIFPKHIKCVFCGAEIKDKNVYDTCEKCRQALPYISNECLRCGANLNASTDNVCIYCKAQNFQFDYARSVFEYRDNVQKLVHQYKFGEQKYLFEPISYYLTKKFSSMKEKIDIVTSVPLSQKRLKKRGYNQSELVARSFCEQNALVYIPLVEKIKDTKPQAELGYADRKENVIDAYHLLPNQRKEIKGKTILLIDDVLTTGATANEVAKVLKSSGANKVVVLTFARAVLKEKI